MSYQSAIRNLGQLRFKRNRVSIGAETWDYVKYLNNALSVWKAIAPVPYAVIAQAQDSGLLHTERFRDYKSASSYYDKLASDSRPYVSVSLWDRVDAEANNPGRQWPGIMDSGYYPENGATTPTVQAPTPPPAPARKGIGFGALAAILAGGVGTIALIKSKKGGAQ